MHEEIMGMLNYYVPLPKRPHVVILHKRVYMELYSRNTTCATKRERSSCFAREEENRTDRGRAGAHHGRADHPREPEAAVRTLLRGY